MFFVKNQLQKQITKTIFFHDVCVCEDALVLMICSLPPALPPFLAPQRTNSCNIDDADDVDVQDMRTLMRMLMIS